MVSLTQSRASNVVIFQSWRGDCLVGLLILLCLASARSMFGQAAPAQVGGREMVTLGSTFSSYRVNYGDRLILGAGLYVDIDYDQHHGIEGEGRWLWLRQRDGVHDSTYLIGPRYSFNGFVKRAGSGPDEGVGREKTRFRPYAKMLVGVGQFHYPYGYATGSYFVLAPGGGVDYRVSRRIRVRLVDLEYQVWPQFTYGRLTSLGVSSGLRFRIF